MRFPFYCGIAFMMLLSSCATKQPVPTQLPAEIDMNKDAGHGTLLFVTVQLQDGEQFPFLLDNGTPITCLDKSLEPKLGKPHWRRLHVALENYLYNGRIYNAPKFFLGKAQLVKTGRSVVTLDLRTLSLESGHPILGIIGSDILQHYCLQLDFTADKIRFLDDQQLDKTSLGKPFQLVSTGYYGLVDIQDNLAGAGHTASLVDLGCLADGWLRPGFYRQWTNQSALPKPGRSHSPDGILGGETYTNIALGENVFTVPAAPFSGINAIGLRFLSRHLVTLDFPEMTMYLKRTGIGPLDNNSARLASKSERSSVGIFLTSLMEKGQLPGWSKQDRGTYQTSEIIYNNTIIVDAQKNWDPTVCHYIIGFSPKDTSWRLERAWQTDANGGVIQEYAVK